MKLKSISGGTHYRISDADAGKLARATGVKLPDWGREVRVQMPSGQLAWLRRETYPQRLYTDAPKRGWVWIVWDSQPLTSNARGGSLDQEQADELKLFIDNDYPTYQKGAAYREALVRRMQQGKFDLALAAKGFGWIVDEGAKKYAKDVGGTWNRLFTPATRKQVAKEMAEEWANEYRVQNASKRNGPDRFTAARVMALKLRNLGTKREAALTRVQKKFELTAAERRALVRSVWRVTENLKRTSRTKRRTSRGRR